MFGKSRMRLKLFGNFKGEWKPIIPQWGGNDEIKMLKFLVW